MSALQNDKVWIGGGAAAATLLIAGTWFLAIGPELTHASSLRDQTRSTQLQNTVLQSKTNRLRQDSANLPKLTGQLRAQLDSLPVGSDLAEYSRQLDRQATASRVDLRGITVGAPGAVTATGASGGGPGTGGAAAGRLFGIPITLTTVGPLSSQRSFLTALQDDGPRASLVGSTKIVPTGTQAVNSIDPGSSMTTQLTVFVAPRSATDTAQLNSELGKNSTS
jgi:hypothetical protein